MEMRRVFQVHKHVRLRLGLVDRRCSFVFPGLRAGATSATSATTALHEMIPHICQTEKGVQVEPWWSPGGALVESW